MNGNIADIELHRHTMRMHFRGLIFTAIAFVLLMVLMLLSGMFMHGDPID